MNKWDKHFIEAAKHAAQMSKDPSTQCGAVIVRTYEDRAPEQISLGFNGFPAKCSDDEEYYADRDLKYARVVHAEMNAILSAHQSLHGCTMYTHPGGIGPSCDRCSAHIIQAGITTVKHIYEEPSPGNFNERWAGSIGRGLAMYEEAGVEVVGLKYPPFGLKLWDEEEERQWMKSNT